MILYILFWISAFLVLYAYVLYPILLKLLDSVMKPKLFKQADILPKVSLIIAAYNEEKVIESRIRNCLSLNYPRGDLEIIIASDGSSDKTNDIVRKFQDQGVLLYDYQQRRGKVNVLNETVPKASHGIIIFSDANSMFKHDAVKNLVRHFGDPKIGCVCGGLQFVNANGGQTGELEGFYWRYETMLKKLEGKRGALLGANGAIFAIRKELYHNCPPDTIVEDFYIAMKILEEGYAVIYDPEASAIEETTQRFIQETKRRIRIGAGDFQALFRLMPMLNPARGFPALAFFSHKALRWMAPFFLIITFVSNVILIDDPFYLGIFIFQCIFYGFALIGRALSFTQRNYKPFSMSYYFVSMNIALLLGFFRYIQGTQKVAWERTER